MYIVETATALFGPFNNYELARCFVLGKTFAAGYCIRALTAVK